MGWFLGGVPMLFRHIENIYCQWVEILNQIIGKDVSH